MYIVRSCHTTSYHVANSQTHTQIYKLIHFSVSSFSHLTEILIYREDLSLVKNENNKLEIRLAGMEGSLSVETEVVQQQQRQLKADREVVDELQGTVAAQATLIAELEAEAAKDKQLAQKLAVKVDDR